MRRMTIGSIIFVGFIYLCVIPLSFAWSAEVSPPESLQPLVFQNSHTLLWEDGVVNGYASFHLYRGDVAWLFAGNYGSCLQSSIENNTAVDTDIPAAGTCWFYLVTGEDSPDEGTMGDTSNGIRRPNFLPCSYTGSSGFYGTTYNGGNNSTIGPSLFEDRPGFNKDGATFRGIEEINEQIDFYNGTLKFNLSLFDFPQNGGLRLPVSIDYSNNGIERTDINVNMGAGWRILIAELLIDQICTVSKDPNTGKPESTCTFLPNSLRMTNFRETFFLRKRTSIEENGEWREVAIFRTESGHSIMVGEPYNIQSEFIVYLNDGTVYKFGDVACPRPPEGSSTTWIKPVSRIIDRSGKNSITISHERPQENGLGRYYKIKSIVDSLGRNYRFNYWGPGSVNLLDGIEVFSDSSLEPSTLIDHIGFVYTTRNPADEADFRFFSRDIGKSEPSQCIDSPFSFAYRNSDDYRGQVEKVFFPQGGIITYAYEEEHEFFSSISAWNISFELNTVPPVDPNAVSIIGIRDAIVPTLIHFSLNTSVTFLSRQWRFSDGHIEEDDDDAIDHQFGMNGVFWAEFHGEADDGTFYSHRFVGTAGGPTNGDPLSGGVPSARFKASYYSAIFDDSQTPPNYREEYNPVKVYNNDTVYDFIRFSIDPADYNADDYYYYWQTSTATICTNDPLYPGVACTTPNDFTHSFSEGMSTMLLRVVNKSDRTIVDNFSFSVMNIPYMLQSHYLVGSSVDDLVPVDFSSTVDAEAAMSISWYYGDGRDSNADDESPTHHYLPGLYVVQARFVGDESGDAIFPSYKCHVVTSRILETTRDDVLFKKMETNYQFPNYSTPDSRTTIVTGPKYHPEGMPVDEPLYTRNFTFLNDLYFNGKLEEYRIIENGSPGPAEMISENVWTTKPMFIGMHQVAVLADQWLDRDGATTRTTFSQYDDFQQWRTRKDWGIVLENGSDAIPEDNVINERDFLEHLPVETEGPDPRHYIIGLDKSVTLAEYKSGDIPYDDVVEYTWYSDSSSCPEHLQSTIRVAGDATTGDLVTSWTWNSETCNVATVTDPSFTQTGYAWQWGTIASKQIAPLSYPEFSRVNGPRGEILTESDSNGNVTAFGYEAITHRLIEIAPPLSNPAHAGYATDGRTIMYWTGAGSSPGPDDPLEVVHYDSFGRLHKQVTYVFNDMSVENAFVQFWRYDTSGRIYLESSPLLMMDTVTIDTVPANAIQDFRYDLADRIVQKADDSFFELFDYGTVSNGTWFSMEHTDKSGIQTTTYRDGLGNIAGFDYAPAGDFSSVRWAYERDPKNGNILRITSPEIGTLTHQERFFYYDGLNRLVGQEHPESGLHEYVLEPMGIVGQWSYPGGGDVFYSHDIKQRLTEKFQDDADTSYHVTWDSPGQNGFISSIVSCWPEDCETYIWHEKHFTYDAEGRPTKETFLDPGLSVVFNNYGGTLLSTEYEYTDNGSLAKIRYPSGLIVTYTWRRGFIESVNTIIDGVETIFAEVDRYNPDGSPASFRFGPEVSCGRTLGKLNRLDDIFVGTSEWNASMTYGYFPDGTIATITSVVDDNPQTFQQSYLYDDMKRLTRVEDSGGWYQQYSYDTHGNMIGMNDDGTSQSFVYSWKNQIVGDTWSASGQLTNDGDFVYSFGQFDRLERIKTDTNQTVSTFLYDIDDRRVHEMNNYLTWSSFDEHTYIHHEDRLLAKFSIRTEPGIGYVDCSARWENYIYLANQRIGKIVFSAADACTLYSINTNIDVSFTEYCNGTTDYFAIPVSVFGSSDLPDRVEVSIPDTGISCQNAVLSEVNPYPNGMYETLWFCQIEVPGGWDRCGGRWPLKIVAHRGAESLTRFSTFDITASACGEPNAQLGVQGTVDFSLNREPLPDEMTMEAFTDYNVSEVVCFIYRGGGATLGQPYLAFSLEPVSGDYSHWRLTVPWTGQGRLFQYLFVARDESVQPCGYDMTEHESVILESTFPLDSFSEYAFVNDHLGTTRWILDVADGSVQWPEVPGSPGEPYMDTPFGMARNLDEEQDHRNDFRISGKERIPETPLVYFEARFLKAAGPPRFISPDPSLSSFFYLANPQSLNLYSYCRGNPINLVDQTGEFAIIPILLGAWVASEFILSAADAISTLQTLFDPNASSGEKTLSTSLFVMGLYSPGGGGSTVIKYSDDVADGLIKGTRRKVVAPGEIPKGSLAGRCDNIAKANLDANPGSKLVYTPESKVTHYAVELPDGRILDPSLRDNLATYGARVEDIPIGQNYFTRENWLEFINRFPSSK